MIPSVNACHAIMLLQELAAAEAALSAARQEGEDALVAAREQYEAELLLHQQKLRDAKGAVRQREQDLQQRVTELEVGASPWPSPLSLSLVFSSPPFAAQDAYAAAGCVLQWVRDPRVFMLLLNSLTAPHTDTTTATLSLPHSCSCEEHNVSFSKLPTCFLTGSVVFCLELLITTIKTLVFATFVFATFVFGVICRKRLRTCVVVTLTTLTMPATSVHVWNATLSLCQYLPTCPVTIITVLTTGTCEHKFDVICRKRLRMCVAVPRLSWRSVTVT